MQLNPMHLTVAKLLDGRLFRIPEYQRAYSWQKKQRQDLFEDIREAHKSENEHFMATIVALSRDTKAIGADEYKVVELVDGQQRVTTIVILLKAIEMALSEDDKHASKAKASLSDLLVKSDDHEMILLQTNHDSSSVFKEYIQTGVISEEESSTAADKNLIDAAKECAQFVEAWQQDESFGDLVSLLGIIRNRLSMIFHEIDDEAIVYRVFEVLNSRGLDVKWIDKTKSQLMASIFEHTIDKKGQEDGLHEMHTIWKEIYKTLGLREDLGNEALRFAGTFAKSGTSPNKILSEEKASQELRNFAGKKIKTLISCAEGMKKIARVVRQLHDDPRLNAITTIRHARFLATAILLRKFDDKDEQALLKAWERATFRIFVLGGADARSEVGGFVRLGFDVYKGELTAEEILTSIQALGEGYSIDELSSDDEYWDNCYNGWTEELRYILYRYDEHLAHAAGEGINSIQWNKIWADKAEFSIEHIAPQKSGRSDIHDIGNLAMLPPKVNSSLGGKPPKEKATKYIESGLRGTIDAGKEIQGNPEWTEKDVECRRQKIVEFIHSEWGQAKY
ncbi:DUF262 domain-containing protein [Halocynthiibacter styelae]|uniref:DUF262 domain-containing protein n=1 Tax=Halocynthiibacter styelae TaxID=2761955 RepID=A0A8J7IBP8_9RHOB|nr:DUF262 domain-containing protein [Paenihalocynthiibacter styelae]MBI1492448.1 DUF262 domain-containing protein [Paenihalocynthiibacter styelae]